MMVGGVHYVATIELPNFSTRGITLGGHAIVNVHGIGQYCGDNYIHGSIQCKVDILDLKSGL
jgi:hypothetical protein